MICTGVDKMRISDFVKKVVFPIIATVFLFTLFYPLCVDNRGCDYLKLWLLSGIPFGIHRMFVWVIPRGFDVGGTLGILVINLLVGGVIGGMIMTWCLVLAALYFVKGIASCILWVIRKGYFRQKKI